MKTSIQSSLAGLALITSAGCSEYSVDYAHISSLSCDGLENPTATIRMKTIDKVNGICSYSRVEVVPGDVYYNTAKYCLTMSDEPPLSEDGVLTKSLTKTGQKINPNIESIQALGTIPKALPVSRYTNVQMDNKSVTLFISNPNNGSKTKSCYKITGPYVSSDNYGFVMIQSDDFDKIANFSDKENTFGGSSGSAVLDHEGRMFGRLIASSNSNLGMFGTMLLIHPIRRSDGSITAHKTK